MNNCGVIGRLRSFRILNMAVFDWVATAIAAYFAQRLWFPDYQFWQVMIMFTAVAVATHYFLKIDTMFNYYLGLGNKPIRIQC